MLDIFFEERARRPEAEARDFCKLIYQSEFGGGHLIADPEASLARLREECRTCAEDSEAAFARVGGGLLRLNLRARGRLGLRLETINGLFVYTAAHVRGSVAGLEKKLTLLRENAPALGLERAALEAEISAWRAAGYPAPAHSAAYRRACAPAYRLAPEQAERFLPLFQRVDALLRQRSGVRVAIDGNSGAGKSTLGALLAEVYGANLYHMDDFFLPPERKTRERLAEPGGNVDRERFEAEVLARLGTALCYRPWDCRAGALGAPVRVSPRPVEIVEGVYSLHPALRAAYDLRVFLAVAPEVQMERIRVRSGAAMLKRFAEEWIPLENTYFDRLQVRAGCDIAFDV